MNALINGLTVPFLIVAQLWAKWAFITLAAALVAYGLAWLVNHPTNKPFVWWWNLGILGPPRLAIHLLGPKPKKKKGKH